MQVITLNPEAFEEHAARLASDVAISSPTRFDAIVAVRRGGSHVCDAFLHYFPSDRYGKRFDITLQRPSTKRKGGGAGKLLKRLPYAVLNAMRMAESYLLTLQKNGMSILPDVDIPDELTAMLSTIGKPEILIIDDAIDSGDTLSAIADAIGRTNREANVSIAVMTETTLQPRIHATYTLYRNRTLIRFPWSNDYKPL